MPFIRAWEWESIEFYGRNPPIGEWLEWQTVCVSYEPEKQQTRERCEEEQKRPEKILWLFLVDFLSVHSSLFYWLSWRFNKVLNSNSIIRIPFALIQLTISTQSLSTVVISFFLLLSVCCHSSSAHSSHIHWMFVCLIQLKWWPSGLRSNWKSVWRRVREKNDNRKIIYLLWWISSSLLSPHSAVFSFFLHCRCLLYFAKKHIHFPRHATSCSRSFLPLNMSTSSPSEWSTEAASGRARWVMSERAKAN